MRFSTKGKKKEGRKMKMKKKKKNYEMWRNEVMRWS